MGSYGIATVFRNPRHDSFNRKLADELTRSGPTAGAPDLSGDANEQGGESSDNWMRHHLAGVKKHDARATGGAELNSTRLLTL